MRTSIGTAAAVALACGLAVTACTSGGGPVKPAADEPVALGNIKLVAYTGCDDMLDGLREAAAKNVGPWGFGGNMIFYAADGAARMDAKAVAPSYSTTNVHEAGVDEPDMVKTDGRRIISYAGGVLRVIDAASKKVTGTLRLVPKEQAWAPGDLLVHGDRALVMFSGGEAIPVGAVAKRPATAGPKYTLVDLKELKVLGSITPQGMHVDARMVGSTVRLVVRSQPTITFAEGRPDEKEDERTRRNQNDVRNAPIEAWLPTYEVDTPGEATRTEKLKCEAISHPAEYTGTSMLTVHTIDLEAGLTSDDPIAVAADGDTVYATPTSLYVTSNPRWWFPRMMIDDTPPAPVENAPSGDVSPAPATTPSAAAVPGAAAAPETAPTAVAPRDPATTTPAEKIEPSNDPSMPSLLPEPTASPSGPAPTTPVPASPTEPTGSPTAEAAPPEQTEIHRFDIGGAGAPRYVASGVVPGRLLNQYSLSDFQGNLRVATTSDAAPGANPSRGSSGVYVLKADTLAKVGEVTGLGKGERIYSVRFIGPVGYVVTFRQVDPLYTLDLRDPANPKVTGELKITGYSAYLHPAGEGRLLGIGQEASEQGRTLGMQVSLFDVSDPAKPARLAQFHQKDSGSEAEWDPHAFLYWPESGLAVVPVNSWGGPDPSTAQMAAMVLKVGDGSITRAGLVTHPKQARTDEPIQFDTAIRRCLIIGDTLWTVSDTGMKASSATTLAGEGWIPFEV
ncbi:beta-propeller domain-containing protein [Sphaerisporangium sp. NPDC051011]|uniref:beta-propeller domain-containing protein n=1 Tax=Sphaerisporangium sp. NPDC051011 TaxID=3155792 RepID=UPI0033E1F2F8